MKLNRPDGRLVRCCDDITKVEKTLPLCPLASVYSEIYHYALLIV